MKLLIIICIIVFFSLLLPFLDGKLKSEAKGVRDDLAKETIKKISKLGLIALFAGVIPLILLEINTEDESPAALLCENNDGFYWDHKLEECKPYKSIYNNSDSDVSSYIKTGPDVQSQSNPKTSESINTRAICEEKGMVWDNNNTKCWERELYRDHVKKIIEEKTKECAQRGGEFVNGLCVNTKR